MITPHVNRSRTLRYPRTSGSCTGHDCTAGKARSTTAYPSGGTADCNCEGATPDSHSHADYNPLPPVSVWHFDTHGSCVGAAGGSAMSVLYLQRLRSAFLLCVGFGCCHVECAEHAGQFRLRRHRHGKRRAEQQRCEHARYRLAAAPIGADLWKRCDRRPIPRSSDLRVCTRGQHQERKAQKVALPIGTASWPCASRISPPRRMPRQRPQAKKS